ncbi:hypothetical protein [Streptomyces bacillaris]|uniref:hypothetical protein n=1 Tax=Streptomyces bacillaris TaxID=68179 RepID=UPI00113ABABA|nr:hypothetical protein EQG64_05300 [Streptomyces sp. S6]
MQQKLRPIGPEYFNDQDRDYAVEAGVELVNALRKLGVDLEGIGVSAPCDRCSSVGYVLDLGPVEPAQALKMAATINDYAKESKRLREPATPSPKRQRRRRAKNLNATL